MTNNFTGVNFNVVLNLITKYGSSVTITPVVKTTSNISGDETLTEGTSFTATLYVSRKTSDWFVDQAGLIKGGDLLIVAPPTTDIDKDYVVTFNGDDYRVHYVISRDQAGGTAMFKTVSCYLI
jgi:hypothetical protein